MDTIIITGTSRGLGNEIMKNIDKGKYITISLSRSFSANDISLSHKYNNVHLIETDLSHLMNKGVWGGVEIEKILLNGESKKVTFINNAAVINPIGKLGIDEEEIIQSMNVNYYSPVLLINHLLKLKDQIDFNLEIINISSGAANRPIAGWALYCSAKAGMKMFLDVIDEQYGTEVKVVHVDPGVMDTGMQELIRENKDEHFPDANIFYDYYKKGILRKPEEVAKDIIGRYL